MNISSDSNSLSPSRHSASSSPGKSGASPQRDPHGYSKVDKKKAAEESKGNQAEGENMREKEPMSREAKG